MKNGEIDFDHVTFRYSATSEKPVLDDIDLKIRSGMTVGIVGGTGSAKSSLVQLVPRLYDVTEGSLKVGGVDVRDYDLEVLRDQVCHGIAEERAVLRNHCRKPALGQSERH